MAYVNFKDLTRRTASDKVLHDKVFNIAKNLKYMMDIKEVLLQWFMNSLIKKLLLRVQINLLAAVLKMRIFQTKC